MSADFIPRTDLIDVYCIIYAETDNGVLVSTARAVDSVMLSKSQIEIEYRDQGGAIVTLQRWLAAEKGLT